MISQMIDNLVRLLQLPEPIQEKIEAKEILYTTDFESLIEIIEILNL